jgi:hypothetical protein
MTLKNKNLGIIPAIDYLSYLNETTINIDLINNGLDITRDKFVSLDNAIQDYTLSAQNISYWSTFAATSALTNFGFNSAACFLPCSAILSHIIPTPVAVATSFVYLGMNLYAAHYSASQVSSSVEYVLNTVSGLIGADYQNSSTSLSADNIDQFDWINDSFVDNEGYTVIETDGEEEGYVLPFFNNLFGALGGSEDTYEDLATSFLSSSSESSLNSSCFSEELFKSTFSSDGAEESKMVEINLEASIINMPEEAEYEIVEPISIAYKEDAPQGIISDCLSGCMNHLSDTIGSIFGWEI